MASPDPIRSAEPLLREPDQASAVRPSLESPFVRQADCGRVAASDLAGFLGLPIAIEHQEGGFFACRRLRPGELPVRTGDRCHHLYIVIRGSFCMRILDPDGQERVIGFQRAGDTLGLDGLASGRYTSESVALESAIVAMIPVTGHSQAGHGSAGLATFICRLLARQIIRDKATLALMAASHALTRLGAFLLDWYERGTDGNQTVQLSMNRTDMASFLGLSRETVSRACTHLGRAGIVAVRKNRFTILDPAALRRTAAGALSPCRWEAKGRPGQFARPVASARAHRASVDIAQ